MDVRLIIIGFEIIAGGALVAVISMIMGADPVTLARRGLHSIRTVAELGALCIIRATLPVPRKTTRKIGRHRDVRRSFVAA